MGFIEAVGGNVAWFFSYLLPFLFVLSIVIFVHELGHFLVGRWCGVGVKVFALGFGPELAGFTDRRGTRWRLAAIPLGGYVKFAGDANAASQPDGAAAAMMSEAEKRESFMHKSVAQRSAIVAAGPIANFLLAIAIFTATFMAVGQSFLNPIVGEVIAGGAAERAGFVAGDRIVSIDGREIRQFEQIQRVVSGSADAPLAFVVERDGRQVNLVATPELREFSTRFGKLRQGVIGLRASTDPADRQFEQLGPAEALSRGAAETWFVVDRTFAYIGGMIAGRESADQLSGPMRIAQVSGEVAKVGVAPLLNLAAILSVSIGLINLFPIPMLDGGHLVFYALEALRRRPLSERTQEIGFRIGFALVIMLMIFATWNDILHLRSL